MSMRLPAGACPAIQRESVFYAIEGLRIILALQSVMATHRRRSQLRLRIVCHPDEMGFVAHFEFLLIFWGIRKLFFVSIFGGDELPCAEVTALVFCRLWSGKQNCSEH